MKIITTITVDELKTMSHELFGDMVKAVVDVERELVALDAELHSDLEALLLENGSKQKNLWGINLYPEMNGEEFVQFDSMINVRPAQGNKTRGVDNPVTRERILHIINKSIKK